MLIFMCDPIASVFVDVIVTYTFLTKFRFLTVMLFTVALSLVHSPG